VVQGVVELGIEGAEEKEEEEAEDIDREIKAAEVGA
jgi:hypothetical protein